MLKFDSRYRDMNSRTDDREFINASGEIFHQIRDSAKAMIVDSPLVIVRGWFTLNRSPGLFGGSDVFLLSIDHGVFGSFRVTMVSNSKKVSDGLIC